MRRLLVCLVAACLWWPASATAAIGTPTCVTIQDGWPGAGDLAQDISISGASGDTAVVFGGISINRTVTITDSASNSWASAVGVANTAGSVGTVWGKGIRLPASVTTITVTLSGSAAGFATACVFSGGADPVATDGSDTHTTTGVMSHAVNAAITTSVANTIFFGWGYCGNGNYTRDATYTAINEQLDGPSYDVTSGYRIFSSTTSSHVMTFTSLATETCDLALVAYAGAASAAGKPRIIGGGLF